MITYKYFYKLVTFFIYKIKEVLKSDINYKETIIALKTIKKFRYNNLIFISITKLSITPPKTLTFEIFLTINIIYKGKKTKKLY